MRIVTIAKIVAVFIGVVVGIAVGFVFLFDFGPYTGLMLQAVQDSTGRKLEIDGKLKLHLGVAPSVSVEGVRFANAPWGSRPDMVRIEKLIVEVALAPLFSGEVRVSRVVLRGADILLEADGKGQANWVFDNTTPADRPQPAADQDDGAPTIPTFDLVVVENARLTWRDGSGGNPLVFVIKRLEGRADGPDDPVSLNVEGAYNGNAFTLNGMFGAISALASGGSWPVDVSLRGGGAVVSAKGRIARPMLGEGVEVDFSIAGKDLSAMGGLAGVDLPALGPYSLKGRIDQPPGKSGKWRIAGMQAGLGASKFKGNVEFTPGGARPVVSVKLISALVDLADFSEPGPGGAGGEGASEPVGTGEERLFSADPLPVELLKAVDATVTLVIDKVKTGGIDISRVRTDMSLRNGLLRLRSFHFGVAGGEVAASVELTAAGDAAQANLRVKLTQVDLGELLQRLEITDMVKGKLDADVQLSGTGGSVRDLMASLDGTTSVVMGKGAIDSRYVNLIGADVLRTIVPWASDNKGTTVNCAVSRFLVKDGIATSQALLFDTNLVTIGGKGQIDLGSEKLNLTLLPKPKDASLLSLAAPINVTGTLASPRAAPDTAEVAKKVAIGLIGGLINPLGILVPLVSGGSKDKNPCVAALAARGGAPASATRPQPKPEDETPVEKIGSAIKGIGDSIGKGLKSLFGQ